LFDLTFVGEEEDLSRIHGLDSLNREVVRVTCADPDNE
jgi:hypothetical protein